MPSTPRKPSPCSGAWPMKFIDEFRDQALVQDLARRLAALAALTENPATIMEVCGTHTMAAARFGLKTLLPPEVKLISGPGCPVCVTAQSDLDAFLALGTEPRRGPGLLRRHAPGPRHPHLPGRPAGPGGRGPGGLLPPGRGGVGPADPGQTPGLFRGGV